jgi:hypothetical protein
MTNLRMKRDGISLILMKLVPPLTRKKRVQWEREASNLKGELNNICEENANYTRQCEALEDKNNRANNDLDSMTNSIGVHRLRINGLRRTSTYDELVKKLDEM